MSWGLQGSRTFQDAWEPWVWTNCEHPGCATALVTHSGGIISRGVRNVINCRPGTRINFERVPGYPLKIHNSTITVIESCWSGRHLANN